MNWERIREGLQQNLPAHIFHSLVEATECAKDEDELLELRFHDRFTKETFEQKCLPSIKSLISELKLNQLAVNLAVKPSKEAKGRSQLEFDLPAPKQNPFDQKYSFETFVVGTSNQFAHAACQAVSRQPGNCYNPLFIFGGAGLGKTHLLKALGHHIFSENEDARILLLTSETFTNELIQAIRTDRMREFREKFRNRCDVLLIDDVHFMAGKERTQEEFFYTFNYLHESRKQIVVTSDRYPKDIQGLEKRLQTRFEWGLVADVQPPEMETRMAILKNKAESEHIALPDSVAQYMASHITNNVRELEGSLHKLEAYAALSGSSISIALAQQVFKSIAPKVKHELTAEGVLKLVALHFNVKGSDLKSGKRLRKLSVPRQICMYVLRKHLGMSFPEIGRFLGGKDHSTIMHGISRISNAMGTDSETLNAVSQVESLIR